MTQQSIQFDILANDRASAPMDRFADSMKRVSKESAGTKKNLRIVRGGIGQIGHQIQDVSVQLQGGQSPFIILGQQGSQIASLFGNGGPMIGAIIAVGAALSGVLFNSLQGVSGEFDDVIAKTRETNKEFEELSARQIALIRLDLKRSISASTSAMEEQEGAISDTEKTIAQITNTLETRYGPAIEMMENGEYVRQEQVSAIRILQDRIAKLSDEIVIAGGASDNAADDIARFQEELDNLNKGIFGTKPELKDQRDLMEELAKATELQAETLGFSTTQQILHKAALDGANASQLERIRLAREDIDLFDKAGDDAKAAEASAKAVKTLEDQLATEEQAITESLLRRTELIIANTDEGQKRQELLFKSGQKFAEESLAREEAVNKARLESQVELFNGLSGLFDEGTKAHRTFAAAGKAIALKEAIISNSRNILSAAGQPFPLNIPAVAFATAQGLAAIGSIRAASFEGGGFFNGARVGGADGKGGKFAMLHPNEKVIDMEQGGGEGPSFNFNVQANDSKGFREMLRNEAATIVGVYNTYLESKGRRAA